MKRFRLACAFAVAVLGAVAIAEAHGKPPGVPPSGPPDTSDPPDTVLELVCSYLPSLPICD